MSDRPRAMSNPLDYSRALVEIESNLKVLESALPNRDYTESGIAISRMLQDLYVLRQFIADQTHTAQPMIYAHLDYGS